MKLPFQFPRLKRRGKKKAGRFLKSKYYQRLKYSVIVWGALLKGKFKLVSYIAYLSPSNDLLTIPLKQKSTIGAVL